MRPVVQTSNGAGSSTPAPVKTKASPASTSPTAASGSTSPGWQQPSSTQKPSGTAKFRNKMKGMFGSRKKK